MSGHSADEWNFSMNNKTVVIIGAAGQMMSVTARALGRHRPDLRLVLADFNEAALARLGQDPALQRATKLRLDLTQAQALRSAIARADLVVHGAGPFFKTAKLVRAACLDVGVDYLDIDDDVESCQEAMALDAAARERGVRLLAGCGASPGLTNLLAADALAGLDVTHELELAWCIGDEGRQDLGRAVAEHALHIGAGDCVIIEGGRAVVRESMSESTVFPMGGVLGGHRLYLSAHPETVQLGFSHPYLRRVLCWGGFDPAPFSGVVRGVALAVRQGRLSEDVACHFLREVAADRLGSLAGWRCALQGLGGQWRRGEISGAQLWGVVRNSVLGRHGPCRSGLAARAVGLKNGRPHQALRQTVPLHAGARMPTMAEATGLAAAQFVIEALDRPSQRMGTLFPQMWVTVDGFIERLQGLGLAQTLEKSDEALSPARPGSGSAGAAGLGQCR